VDKWDWSAIVAVILAVGVTGSLLLLSFGELFHDGHLTEAETTTVSTLLGAGIGAIATYLGGRNSNGK
jgi:membrane protein DedA with SNARE-associated domain